MYIFPYFIAHGKDGDQNELFQICPGTEVTNKYNHSINADISFQKAKASIHPMSSDLILIIDAKHEADDSKRITADDVKVFAMDVKNFEIPDDTYKITFEAPLEFIDKCAIITNAKPHLDSDGMLAAYGCIIVYDFYPERNHVVMR